MLDFQKQATGQLGGPRTVVQGGRAQLEQADTSKIGTEQLLGGLAKLAGGIAERGFVDATERAYIEGERQRQLGAAFADIDSNMFAKPFLRGGYQDQDYRIKQAELSTNVQSYLAQEGRTQDPEAFQDYLRAQTEGLYERVGRGMTTSARQNMITSQMTLEGSLTQQHATEHQKYVIGEAGKRLSASATGLLGEMQSALTQGYNLEPLVAQAADLLDSIPQQFPEELAQTLVADFMKQVYRDGNVEIGNALFDAINRTDTLSILPMEKQVEIQAARKTALKDTKFRRSAGAVVMHSALLKRHAAGEVIEPREIPALIQALDGTHFSERDMLKLMQIGTSSTKVDKVAVGAEAFGRGDYATLNVNMIPLSTSGEDYATMMFAANAETPAAAIPIILDTGIKRGYIPQRAVDKISEAFQSVMYTDDWEAEKVHSDTLQATMDSISLLNKADRTAAIAKISAKMPEELRPMLLNIANQTTGVSLQDKVQQATQHFANKELGNYSAVQGSAVSSEMRKAVQSETTPNFYAKRWRVIKNIVGFGEATPEADSVGLAVYQSAVQEEAMKLASDPVNAALYSGNAEFIAGWAAENVDARTVLIRPEGGDAVPLVMPEINGKVLFKEELYGATDANGEPLLQSVDNREIGEALVELYKPAGKGQQVAFVSLGSGDIYVTQVDKTTGRPVLNSEQKVSATEVAKQIDKFKQEKVKTAAAVEYGAMVRNIPDGAGGRVNTILTGQNTAGVHTYKVFDWRKELIGFEGYKNTVYLDTEGNPTAGIGHKLPAGTKVGKAVTDAQIQEWYSQDTNRALEIAERTARAYGFSDDHDTMIAVAGAAFQLGESGLSKFDESLRIIAEAQDFDALVKNSETWKWKTQTPERTADFLKKVKGRFDARKRQP